jgi:hypothetical protein
LVETDLIFQGQCHFAAGISGESYGAILKPVHCGEHSRFVGSLPLCNCEPDNGEEGRSRNEQIARPTHLLTALKLPSNLQTRLKIQKLSGNNR